MNKPTRILTATVAAVLLVAGSGTVGYQLGSAPAVYTTNYAPTGSGWSWYVGDSRDVGAVGDLALGANRYGFFIYSDNAMNELQGRTILSARIYLPRVSGGGSVTMQTVKGSVNPSCSAVSTGGWASVPLTRINELVQGTGSTVVRLTGSGTLQGVPAGTFAVQAGVIEVVWSE